MSNVSQTWPLLKHKMSLRKKCGSVACTASFFTFSRAVEKFFPMRRELKQGIGANPDGELAFETRFPIIAAQVKKGDEILNCVTTAGSRCGAAGGGASFTRSGSAANVRTRDLFAPRRRFAQRMTKAGLKIGYEPRAAVYNETDKSPNRCRCPRERGMPISNRGDVIDDGDFLKS